MYSTLYQPCIVWCMDIMYTHALVYLLILFDLFWGERVVKWFFLSNIDMILIVFIIYVILFLWLRLLYHDKSLPFSFFVERERFIRAIYMRKNETRLK